MVTDVTNAVYKAIADPTRRGILDLLAGGGGLSVQEIAEHFTMSRPAISKHLKILKEAGLVDERPDGRQRIYEIVAEPLGTVRAWLSGLATTGGEGPTGGESVTTDQDRLTRDEFEDQWGDRMPSSTEALVPAGRGDWRVW